VQAGVRAFHSYPGRSFPPSGRGKNCTRRPPETNKDPIKGTTYHCRFLQRGLPGIVQTPPLFAGFRVDMPVPVSRNEKDLQFQSPLGQKLFYLIVFIPGFIDEFIDHIDGNQHQDPEGFVESAVKDNP
jgi:hypothetical protein